MSVHGNDRRALPFHFSLDVRPMRCGPVELDRPGERDRRRDRQRAGVRSSSAARPRAVGRLTRHQAFARKPALGRSACPSPNSHPPRTTPPPSPKPACRLPNIFLRTCTAATPRAALRSTSSSTPPRARLVWIPVLSLARRRIDDGSITRRTGKFGSAALEVIPQSHHSIHGDSPAHLAGAFTRPQTPTCRRRRCAAGRHEGRTPPVVAHVMPRLYGGRWRRATRDAPSSSAPV